MTDASLRNAMRSRTDALSFTVYKHKRYHVDELKYLLHVTSALFLPSIISYSEPH